MPEPTRVPQVGEWYQLPDGKLIRVTQVMRGSLDPNRWIFEGVEGVAGAGWAVGSESPESGEKIQELTPPCTLYEGELTDCCQAPIQLLKATRMSWCMGCGKTYFRKGKT